ncbi:MAG: TetR family transcriptional regulator [Acidimicrobiales bacterium]
MAQPARPGLRERKKDATRAALRDAAVELVLEHGYSATTVDQIAARANVSPRTFFRYFATKDDVLYEGHGHRVEAVGRFLADRPPGEALFATLSAVACFLAEDLEQRREVLSIQTGIWFSDAEVKQRVLMHYEDVLERISAHVAQRLGVSESDDLRPRMYAGVVIRAWRTGTRVWLRRGGEGPLAPLVGEAMELVSLREPPG